MEIPLFAEIDNFLVKHIMKFLSKIFGRRTLDKQLEGVWVSDSTDQITKTTIGDITMSFTSDGKLLYDIIEGNKLQRMNLIYWTSGDTLYSDQPSSPRQVGTKYKFENADTLVLEYRGEITKFLRRAVKT